MEKLTGLEGRNPTSARSTLSLTNDLDGAVDSSELQLSLHYFKIKAGVPKGMLLLRAQFSTEESF